MNIYESLEMSCEPFNTSPDPRFLYLSFAHQYALTRLEIAIRMRRGLSVILGDIGTGKTTLARTLVQSFDETDRSYRFHWILNPTFPTVNDFLSHIAKQLGVDITGLSSSVIRERIENHLLDSVIQRGECVVLIIDEGQNLTHEKLEELRTLLNFETNDQKLVQIIIFGQLELFDQLKKIPNFMDRIILKYIIKPLDEHETYQMILYRLKQAGWEKPVSIFDESALRNIYQYTEGYPRRITKLCQTALEHVIACDDESVSADMIEDIIKQDQAWS